MHDEEVLKPTYRIQRPPWVGLWTGTEYKGRPEWWTELNFVDDGSKKGTFKIRRPKFNEENNEWFDPKVEDGTSLAGPMGLDSKNIKNITIKGDTPGDLKSFQDNIYKNSIQYKNIAEKFDISKEHPGIPINPTLGSYFKFDKDMLGRIPYMLTSWHHKGPRFFNKPLNEGTFEKGLCGVKYALIFSAPYTMAKIRAFGTVKYDSLTFKNFMKEYIKVIPVPVALAFTWGSALSASAAIRNKDDCQNHVFASIAVGSVLGTIRGNFNSGLTMALVSMVIGTFWQYQRWSKEGLQGMSIHTTISGYQAGPMLWKWLQTGDHEVPTEKY
uniref:NADH-ubiquinone oxidoreductase subunit B14.7 n=1 Tax=Parastrongyloides trichosuri TaxID=131310 RepID=A0A0N4ZIG2_PARTI